MESRAAQPDNVIELGTAAAQPNDARTCWFDLPGREIDAADWARYRDSMAEIFEAFGMDLETPGTRDTPDRFLRALFEATAGYDGDAKLSTSFPAEATPAPGRLSQ